jgi:hypothetical protein
LHREGKGLPLFFPAPYSFLFEFEKSDFNSDLVAGRFRYKILSLPAPGSYLFLFVFFETNPFSSRWSLSKPP